MRSGVGLPCSTGNNSRRWSGSAEVSETTSRAAMPFGRKAADAGDDADRGERDRFGGNGHPARFG